MADHPTPGESEAAGKAARRRTPRSALGGWEAPSDRKDPVEILTDQDKTRVQGLVPIRHGRMAASAFTFYRGAAAIMAADLAAGPDSGLTAQLCGDAHLSNFGVFAAPDRRLIFDINDFDETHPGPFEWDVKRLAASFAIGGRNLGFSESERRAVVAEAAGEYRREMRRLAPMRTLEVWYERMDIEVIERYRSQVSRKAAKRAEKQRAKAESKNSMRAFARLTQADGGEVRIVSDPPLIVPIEEVFEGVDAKAIEKRLLEVYAAYVRTLDRDVRQLVERYRFVHAAHKVVGVGSVGTRAWILLLLGPDSQDPLFLQAKEAQSSVLEPFTGAGPFKQQGRRVVEGQRLMQAASDIFLGWTTAKGVDGKQRDFYVRQLWDGKGSAEIERMNPTTMGLYGKLCGWTLARAHARSGDRIAIAAYLGKGKAFDRAIGDFAEAYADQNDQDFKEFTQAISKKRLDAVTGL
ncbi:MAG TPA: DUF2252 domain-containing protein [Solirubrobacterales bacterium]|nr:DUF2252 domain-containing protein [Solirubrobacterales bacterium]